MPDAQPALLLAHDGEGNPIHLTHYEASRHVLVVGATGSGKTNQLVAMAASAISGGQGLAFVDGKGDLAAYRRILTLARRSGRGADVRLLNFCDRPDPDGPRVSNTFNPFMTGSAETLTQFVIGMMDQAGGDGAMWRGRAVAMFTGVMGTLVALRDEGLLDLNVKAVRDHLNLRRIIDLCNPEMYPSLPEGPRSEMRAYLASLPGFQDEKKYKQAQTTLDQHGYLEMQFTRALGAFGTVYGHVFGNRAGEVDIDDLCRNRRILVVLLPMVGRSEEERRFLGSTVQAIVGGMLASASRGMRSFAPADPSPPPPPHVVMLDEFSTYATSGMQTFAAQGRSLGFSFVFATQTLVPPPEDPAGHMLDAILSNTATKILMRTDLVDGERFGRIMPALPREDRDEALRAMKDRMASIQGLVAIRSVTGDPEGTSALAWEYAELARSQKAAFERRASVPGASDLQALPTGAMILVRGGQCEKAHAYDLSGLALADPTVAWHLPLTEEDIELEVGDCLDDLRAESGLPPRPEPGDLPDSLLGALAMLPRPDETLTGPDLARLSIAICAAAGQEYDPMHTPRTLDSFLARLDALPGRLPVQPAATAATPGPWTVVDLPRHLGPAWTGYDALTPPQRLLAAYLSRPADVIDHDGPARFASDLAAGAAPDAGADAAARTLCATIAERHAYVSTVFRALVLTRPERTFPPWAFAGLEATDPVLHALVLDAGTATRPPLAIAARFHHRLETALGRPLPEPRLQGLAALLADRLPEAA